MSEPRQLGTDEIEFLLERFDQSSREVQRGIVARLASELVASREECERLRDRRFPIQDDDFKSVTGDWLTQVGFLHESHDDQDYVIDCSWDDTDEHGLDLRLWERSALTDGSWGAGLCAFGGQCRTLVYLPLPIKTRGDVRQLCRSLGVELRQAAEEV